MSSFINIKNSIEGHINKTIYDLTTGGAATFSRAESVGAQLPGRTDGMADAYRHILLSAELTRKYGSDYAATILDMHEDGYWGTSATGMDNYNNNIGIAIGEYVASNNGSYGDVLSLTQEAFQQGFGGETTNSIDQGWQQAPGGYLTSGNSISVDGGGLILGGIAVLQSAAWKNNPKVNGSMLTNAQSNWPDFAGNWLNNFVLESYNYSGSISGDFYSFATNILDALVEGALATPETLELLASELEFRFEELKEDIYALVSTVNTIISTYMEEIANLMKALGLEKFYDPIVLDMDGDGVELISVANSNAQFDFDKDGFNEKAGWVAPDDAFLVWDKNLNGQIDDIDEMFGNETISGFDELRPHTGIDHKLSAADLIYSELRLWNDLDGDGVVDAGELRTLTEAGVVEIDLQSSESNIVEKGNIIADVSTWSDGTNTHQVADVEFLLEQVNSLPQADATNIELTLESVLAPHSRGYGNMLSLQHAISSNQTLALKVFELLELAPEDFHLAYGLVEEVLYEWAGTTDVATDSRGPHFDGRKLATIEAVTGEPMVLFDGSTDPLPASKVQLNATWNMLMNMFQERLLVQGPMRELFPDASYDFMTDTLSLGGDSGALLTNAMSVDTNEDMQEYWFKFIDIVLEHDRTKYDNLTPEEIAALPGYWEGGLAISVNGSPATPDPWNKYKTGFKQEFVDLIKAKLNLDLNDINNDGIEDNLGGNEYVLVNLMEASSGSNTPVDTSVKDLVAIPAVDFQETNDFILGGYGPDALRGEGGSDIIYGGTGNDFLYGGNGSNYMFGGAGDDVLESNNGGADVLYGNDGNDEIRMYGHSHTVDGGKGDDTYRVGGNVTYIWGMGDGNDQVLSYNYGADSEQVLIIDDGLTTNEIRMDVYSNQVEIINDVTGESFKLLVQSDGELDEVHFEDGTVWTLATGAEFRAHDTENSDIGGYIGDDTMIGGAGDDFLRGNGGVDTYIHEVGGGHDSLYGGYDDQEIVLMNGVAAEDLYFNVSATYNLLATDAATGESVTLMNQYNQTNWGYEFGTVNGVDVLGGLTIKGTSATLGENLYGTAFADTMMGGLGNDIIQSGLGQDTFIHEVGDGSDHLYGNGTNDLDIVLMNGVAANDLYFNLSASAGSDLLVTNAATSEQLTLDNMYNLTNYGYEFGTVNGIDITGGLTIKGSSATAGENLYGTTFADTMMGGLGNDTIQSGLGQDTFIHEVGDGTDHLYGNGLNDLDIVLMNGVAANDLYFNVSSSGNDLIVTDAATNEQLTLDNMYHYTNHGYEFGTVNGVDVTGGLTIKGSSATAGENLYGTTLVDTLIGGLGNDIIQGGTGQDTYIHEIGDGNDHLYGGGANDLDIVLMNGVATADLFFNVSVYDLIVTDNATGEQLTLDNMYHYENYGYEFGTVNGVDVTGSLLIQGDGNITGASKADTLQGGTASDVLRGGNGDDVLVASEGSDLLYGQGGADSFVFDDITKSTNTGTYTSVKDFVSGTDIIDLSGIATIDELSDITLFEVGNKTHVSDNSSDFYFVIEGYSAIGLDTTDFIFV